MSPSRLFVPLVLGGLLIAGAVRAEEAPRAIRLNQNARTALVDFLNALTDDRVKFERAPFDPPALCVPVGYNGTATAELFALVPQVGRGGNAVPNVADDRVEGNTGIADAPAGRLTVTTPSGPSSCPRLIGYKRCCWVNTPAPPRTTVRPCPPTSQATPARGWTLLRSAATSTDRTCHTRSMS